MSTSLPLDFPPLVALATEAAQDHTVAFAASCRSDAALWCNIGEESRRARIGAFVRLLFDLTRRESQAVWLGWLALHIAPTVIPPVGCPGWRRLRVPGGVLYALGSVNGLEFVVSFGPTKQIAQLECHDLPDPDAPDAPIRALVLAVLTVGSRGAT